jgi:hypothetical protein
MRALKRAAATVFAWISLASVVGAFTTIIIVSGPFLLVGMGAGWLADNLDGGKSSGRK